MNEIPKIIHYCWFGKGKMPKALKECMKSWEILKQAGYEIKRWDESNCSFDENDFVRKCFAEKKWGYIGDYYRAKALYEIGGVYLDTDVIIQKPFDELLNQEKIESQPEVKPEYKEKIVERYVESRPILGVCEECKNPIYEKDDLIFKHVGKKKRLYVQHVKMLESLMKKSNLKQIVLSIDGIHLCLVELLVLF